MLKNLYPKIENSTVCGANCIMCPRDKFSRPFDNMSFETYKKAIDELVMGGCRNIQLNGFGDCLCDPGIEEKLAYTKSICPDMFISVVNTGHLLNEKNRVILSKYIDMIKFSMYGCTKEVYESVHRGSLKFESVKDNIDRFIDMNPRGEGVYITMAYLCMSENEHEMEQWKGYYEPRVDRVDIWKLHHWTVDVNDESPINGPCFRVVKKDNITICTDGTVVPCCFDFNRDIVLGNINESSIEEILDGEPMRNLFDIHMNGKVMESDSVCRYCDQIRDRSDALIYSSVQNMKVGKVSMKIYD